MHTTATWLAHLAVVSDDILQLIRAYHPRSGYTITAPALEITALRAEAACAVLRSIIAVGEGEPAAQYRVAVAEADINQLLRLFNETWFGVPESRERWKLPGFYEMVDLLEDPPEAEDEVLDDEIE